MADNLVDTETTLVTHLRDNLTDYKKLLSGKQWIWSGAPHINKKTNKMAGTPRIHVSRRTSNPQYTRLGTHKKDYHIEYQIQVYVAAGQKCYVSGTGTTLAEAVDTSETDIDVTSAANMTASTTTLDHLIRITDGTNEDIRKITAINTNTVTIDSACNNSYANGSAAYPYTLYKGSKLLNKICDDIANTLETNAGSLTGIHRVERLDEGGYFYDYDLDVYICPMIFEAWVLNR